MKKKILITLLSLVCVIACAFGLAACDFSNGDKEPEEPVSITVTFETNGGTPIAPITTDRVKTLKTLLDGKTTEKEDKVFDGWYSDASLGESAQVDIDAFIERDTTLYAAWRDYNDAELLENAVKNTRKNAIAAHDAGAVRLNVTSSGYAVPNVILTLDNGVITAGSYEASDKYYKDGNFYYTSEGKNIKLKQKKADTVTEFLYLNVIGTVDYKTHGFYSTFAPLSMFRLADSSLCTFERDGDTFTVTYKGSQSGVGHNWKEENNPWVYFDAGKIFKFTVSDKRVVKVEQIQSTKAYRTIEFFYDGDEDIPAVAEPQNESDYVQKWQVEINGHILLITELNKAELDETAYNGCTQITKNQTYYYDEELKNAVNFDVNGIAAITQHLVLYHPAVNYDEIVVDSFEISLNKYDNDLKLEGTSTEGGIKTTTFVRKDDAVLGTVEFKIEPDPWRAKDQEFTVELVDKQSGEEIQVRDYTGCKSVTIAKSITREYTLKITATTGGYTEYVCIKPMPQAD